MESIQDAKFAVRHGYDPAIVVVKPDDFEGALLPLPLLKARHEFHCSSHWLLPVPKEPNSYVPGVRGLIEGDFFDVNMLDICVGVDIRNVFNRLAYSFLHVHMNPM